MKNVSISLTDQHAAAIEAEIATGDYASVSEVIRAALRDYFDRAPHPDTEAMLADVVAVEAELDAGGALLDAEATRHVIRDLLRG